MVEARLEVGESAVVRPRWWGRSWSVVYAGSVSERTWSVAVQWSMGHDSAAYNLFLPVGTREFVLPVGRVRVDVVSAADPRIRFEPGP